jgi:lysophospholipase L1-like esterase
MRPPRKTVVAAASFALLGVAAWLALRMLEPAAEAATAPAVLARPVAGPLPAARRAPEPEEPLPSLADSGERLETPHQAIEEPDSRPLCAFHAALDDLWRGRRQRPARVAFYGDSLLTSDHLTAQIRTVLQRRFGDGGHGFVLLGKPWRWYKHEGVRHGASDKWRARPLTSDPVPDGMYGLGGVAFELTGMGTGRAWVATDDGSGAAAEVGRFEISYLEQPRGGSFELALNGTVLERVSTAAEERRGGRRIREVPRGPARIQVRTLGDGPVRVFGVALETGAPGVVVDSLAINGARASAMMRYDLDHWRDELRRRDPDLLVLMMGANEGANQWLVLHEYRRHLGEVLRFLREALPGKALLVVGPLDQADRQADGSLVSKKMPRKLSEAQREVALAEGFAFFDTFAAMGGEGSMGKWVQRGLGGADFIHPTEHGARRIGGWLAEALLYGFQERDAACDRSGPDAGADGDAPAGSP